MSAVLGAFLSTWSKARQTFGEGAPQPGSGFDQSAELARLRTEAESAEPESRWSGGAAAAYRAVNVQHAGLLARMAELDRKLAQQVDRSADIVSAGRRDLDDVRDWVLAAAGSVPPTAMGDQMMLPIAQAGLGRVEEVVSASNGQLTVVGAEIARLAGEYQMLGGQAFTQGPPGEPPPTPEQ